MKALFMPVEKPVDKPSILVVDSDPNELKTLAIGLELEGFEVILASTSADAIELLKSNKCQAALVDLMMPKMNGLQLARVVKKCDPEITTILMSAYHLSPIQLSRADTGAVGFVPKPFKFDELVEFIYNKIARRVGDSEPAVRDSSVSGGLHSPFDVPQMA